MFTLLDGSNTMYDDLLILLLLCLPHLVPLLLVRGHHRLRTHPLAALTRLHVILQHSGGYRGVWLRLLSIWAFVCPLSLYLLCNHLPIIVLTLRILESPRLILPLLVMIPWQRVLDFDSCNFHCLCFLFWTCIFFILLNLFVQLARGVPC